MPLFLFNACWEPDKPSSADLHSKQKSQTVSTACSFASTENYLILMVWPCVLDPIKMMLNKSVFHDLQWKPELGVRLHVIDKQKGGKGHVATYRCGIHVVSVTANFTYRCGASCCFCHSKLCFLASAYLTAIALLPRAPCVHELNLCTASQARHQDMSYFSHNDHLAADQTSLCIVLVDIRAFHTQVVLRSPCFVNRR